jgi:acyl-[acyl-carrier-protein]-phospholipid O-acyltransferase/long-chain-fatty-acid--[acyl-carrier-protein] ligase
MPAGTYRALLRTPGYRPLVAAQALGTLNSNTYRIVVALFAARLAGDGGAFYLALGAALFALPYLLFSGYAGLLADRVNKRTVLIAIKVLEIAAMALAGLALWSGGIAAMLGVLFLLGLLAAFFAPAKYGILPELLGDRDLSRGNGLADMGTVVAILLGTTLGAALSGWWPEQPFRIGLLLVAVAVLGTLASLFIAQVAEPDERRPMDWLPWAGLADGWRRLRGDRPLLLTVAGIGYFWFAGALLQLDALLLGTQDLALDAAANGVLQAAMAIGVAIGAVAAGRLSGDKVELGLVPVGGFFTGLWTLALSAAAPSFVGTIICLAALGFAAGFFIVPLTAFLQQRTPGGERGRLVATSNVAATVGILLAALLLWLLHDVAGIGAGRIALIGGLLTFLVTGYILTVVPDFLIRFAFWVLTHSLYRIRITGHEHVPFRGPALLVCNHLSFIDGFLVAACVQRFIRFVVYQLYYDMPALHWLLQRMHAIPMSHTNPKQMIRSLRQAQAELRAGHVVCIFAEGALSRSGNTLPFHRGMERIMQGLDVPVIPVHLDRVWGSIFTFKSGRFFWKWPERLFWPVTVSFGPALPATTSAWEARQAILELGSEAVVHRRTPRDLLHLRFIAAARRHWGQLCIADSTGIALSYGKALAGSLALAKRLRADLPEPRLVGLLLPASVAGALANIALLMAGKVAVNLNFTIGPEALDHSIRQCGMQAIITSRQFLAKAKLAERPGMIFIEDLLKSLSPAGRVGALVLGRLLPAGLLMRLYGRRQRDPHTLAAVLFSSGSTGVPKGVMLSHHNLLSNAEAVTQVLWITREDRVMGVLPFFHSFGLTGTLWIPLILGVGAAYHPNPLDAKTIGQLVARHRATILMATPTFCQGYLRSVEASDFATLRHVVVGAEKLREPLLTAFKAKFGLDLYEGYGCTEMGPVVAVNVADVTHGAMHQTGRKLGTVGHPLPGVATRVVDLDAGATLPQGEQGLLLLKGPGRMLGYLDDPERTAASLRDGWYVTGDVARLDEEGFITITDRLARFSKIGGEMVPHVNLEEAIGALPGIEACAVTGVPDSQRGERLVVYYVGAPEVTAESIWSRLAATALPRLWLPKQQDLRRIDALPLLASGKLDLRRLKQLASDAGA